MSYSFPHVGISRRLGKYVAVFALVASGLTLGIAGTASATPTISEAAGFPVSGESAGLTSLNITPQNVGDLVILSSQIHSQTITVSSVTSADTGTWQMAQRNVDSTNGIITEEVWWAVATATTAATPVTVTYSASVAALSPELVADSYTTSQPSTWSTVVGGGAAATAVTTIAFPSLTSGAGSAQVYWGYAESTATAIAGSTAGFTYTSTSDASGNMSIENPSLTPSTIYAPTASQTSANTTSIAEIFAATQTDTITFNSEGGSAVANMSGPDGTTITLPAAPTLAGSTFDGWFAAASGGTALTSPYTLTGSLTLYAQWTAIPTDTITFNSEGGSAVANMSGPNGSTITLPAAPTLAGSTFDGWFAAASGGTALTSPYTLTGSLTLYAQWTANGGTFTVTFNNNGGQGSLASETASSPTALTLFQTGNMTQTNSYFIGWNTSPTGGGTLYNDGAIYPFTSSVTLYAQWHLVQTGPSLLPLGVTAASGTVTFGSAFTPSATVTAGLTAGDTAVVSGTIFTYAGTDNTTYAASTTAPTAVGTYSVTPSAATVTVTPAADQGKYSKTYAYVAGALTITAPTLTVTAGNVSIKVGGTVTPSATVGGLVGSDTAAVSTATYTYAGTGSTTYASSITAPTAAGTYSITPSAATVTVSPSADATNYGLTYNYVAGTLSIAAVAKPPVVLRATHLIGSIVPGRRLKVTIVGTGFSGRPKITSTSPGTVVVVSKDTGTHLTVWVTVAGSTRPGHATFTIRLANGKSCKIGYVIK